MSEIQVATTHYDDWLQYHRKARWVSYWHQITEVLAVKPATCLEIGIGAGFVRDALTKQGLKVTTVDIDEGLGVDRVGDVRNLPCEDGEFDVVLCSQVLEHIPWAAVPSAVAELRRVCRTHSIVSLPQSGTGFGLSFGISVSAVGSRNVELLCGYLTHDSIGSTDSITGRCCRAERDSELFGGYSPTDSRSTGSSRCQSSRTTGTTFCSHLATATGYLATAEKVLLR
jgi:hypothetical protein